MAKVGGWGGPRFGRCEILTSVKSTMSHGVSPSLHNQSRKPAYSFADRRVGHAIFRCPAKSASFHTRFASFLSAVESGEGRPQRSGQALSQPISRAKRHRG